MIEDIPEEGFPTVVISILISEIWDHYPKPERLSLYLEDPPELDEAYRFRVVLEDKTGTEMLADIDGNILRKAIAEPREWLSNSGRNLENFFRYPVTVYYNWIKQAEYGV